MVWAFEAKTVPSAFCAGASLPACPSCPFPCAAVSQGLGELMVLAGDGLCWITRGQEVPYSSAKVATGGHTLGAGR